jgi:organic radical activating enzyme
MSSYNEQIKGRLDSVSASYCVAKWKQVTVLLQSGQTHSCHHPQPHKVPLDELASNPSALHNTVHKKLQRKLMLEGKRPVECDFCWRVEDLGGVSDRILKSGSDWSQEHIERLAFLPWNHDVSPSYLEVSFSNVCNMACAYCGPINSTRWQKDIYEHGPYNSSEHSQKGGPRIFRDDNNPYLQAFWKWLPTIYGDLSAIRVTGGEPLLSPDTFRLLEYVLENPNPELMVAVNSNLNVDPSIIHTLTNLLGRLNGKVRELHAYVSLDTFGEQATYIRDGLDFTLFTENIRKLVEMKHVQVTVMCTFNALSLPSFDKLISYVAELKKEAHVVLDIPYLRYPEFMSVRVLDQDYVVSRLEELIQQAESLVFFSWEVHKLRWLLDWAKSPISEISLKKMRIDFYRFFSDFDRRRGRNFTATFPELANFWSTCQALSS